MRAPTRRSSIATGLVRTAAGTLACAIVLVWSNLPTSADEPSRPAESPCYVPTAEEFLAGFQQPQRPPRPQLPVYKDRITPHWFHDNTRFWYRNDLRGGDKEFILVDAVQGKRQTAFDHNKLAVSLSKANGTEYKADRLPFGDIEFVKDDKAIRFKVDQTAWQCDLTSYECTKTEEGAKQSQAREGWVESSRPADLSSPQPLHGNLASLARSASEGANPVGLENSTQPSDSAEEPCLLQAPSLDDSSNPPQPARPGRRVNAGASPKSPDGKWTAFIKDYNLFVRTEEGSKEIQLSQDGKEGLAYGLPNWAPDSKTLAAFRIEPGDRKEVYLIESSPRGRGRAKLHKRPYDLPGDKLTAYELNLFQIDGPKQIKPKVERVDLGSPRLHWSNDGSRVAYEKVDRGHQRFRLIGVDARTGEARNLIDEKSQTFIWTAYAEMLNTPLVNWLQKTDEIIYVSERDGWRHLYLIDAREGKVKNQITRGDWAVRGIDRIDEDARQVWFRATGKIEGQDPYFVQYCRVKFDGTNLVALTEGNGSHTVQYSADRNYVIDSYSGVDAAPVHELRRGSDGKLVCALEMADVSELEAGGWKPPEVFVAKGRDGKTDIWGIISRPRNFDPAKKYPVIESIYAGPQGSFVPKVFNAFNRYAAITELGFIVVQIDGMGTANRSKAFHDVCWKNLKDAGFPDRILWHQAVARKYPYYDISRVGIYGTSAGGQNSTGALLFHPDFYKAAVSACGCHDNRMDKASWNEQWMGYPVGPQYAECSNIDNAHRLRGKLLLIVGEMDTNVPPESTYRLVDALIKAGKDFEFLAVPGMGHSNGGAYGVRRMQDFFVRHLHGVEPPDHNAAAGAPTGSRRLQEALPQVTVPPEAFFEKIREKDRDAARKFYKKYIDLKGMPVVASAEVADEALQRTYDIVTHLLAGRPDILEAMVKHGTRLIIIGKDQVYTDMPEYRNHPNPSYQNERVRGTGGLDVTSFGEENLLNLALDRYDDESIAVHEFCHTIDAALGRIDPTWRERLVKTYKSAISKGLWKNAYTASNAAEYWAEICQSYFDCNRINNWNHAPIGRREQLKQFDPDGYELVKTTFKLTAENDWRYRPLRPQPSVMPPPAKFKIDPYYAKFTFAREFVVLGSKRVSDEALLRANDTIRKMFAYRHDILKAMIADGARLVVLGRHEKLSDLPEFKADKSQAGFDEVRYLEYTPELKLMVVPEENVLGLPGDPFADKCMVVSVFAKGLHQVTGLRPVDPDFDRRRGKQQYELRVKRLDIEFDHALQTIYEAAVSKGLWKGTPAARSRAEYWAAGVEAYFDAGGAGQAPNLADRPITSREALKTYDPDLFALVDETMAFKEHVDWRFRRSASP
jgi:dipeptidyl aminopeptidase/acylaminoacyl peptidase